MPTMAHAYTACCLLYLVATTSGDQTNLDEFVDNINSVQSMWVAERSPAAETRLAQLRATGGGIIKSSTKLKTIEHDDEFIRNLPDSFHPMEKWPNCLSLDEIRDQGPCGSCWAHGAVEAMTDRYCIFGSKTPVHISAEDLVTCCPECGGCHGGWPDLAWEHWRDNGIVTGGNYMSNEGCKPYSLRNCSHHTQYDNLPSCGDYIETPVCNTTCRDGYSGSYSQDKHYGNNVYQVENEGNIMAEIYKNGPVEVAFDVYEDFVFYKSGVYKNVKGKVVGGHAVKALGWGVEDGVKYWLIANSWNRDWGEKGFVKFLRGVNHCSIEDVAYAGDPKISE